MIDRICYDIQQRLDQLLAEADKLRRALAALNPRERSAVTPNSTSSQPAAKTAAEAPGGATDPQADSNTDCQDDERRERVGANGAQLSGITSPTADV